MSTDTHPPAYWLQQSDVIADAATVNRALDTLVVQINQALAGQSLIFCCVMRGGLFLAGQLLTRLNMPLQVDYLQANRYRGTKGDDVVWRIRSEVDVAGQTVLVVDDILDQGHTLAAIVDDLRARGAARVLSVVLTEKVLNTPKPVMADFIGLTVPDRYIFGCGMDVYGWWRNLPEIRALKSQ